MTPVYSDNRQKGLDRLVKGLEISRCSLILAFIGEKIDGLTRQLADTTAEHQMIEERLRVRIRLLLQQFGQHLEASIAPPQRPTQTSQPAPATELPPTLPASEAEPSASYGPQLPCASGPPRHSVPPWEAPQFLHRAYILRRAEGPRLQRRTAVPRPRDYGPLPEGTVRLP